MRFVQTLSGLIVVALAVTVVAQDDKAASVTVDSKAPSFKLKDQNGKERTLAELTKDKNVALVFHRSANW